MQSLEAGLPQEAQESAAAALGLEAAIPQNGELKLASTTKYFDAVERKR